MAGFGGAVKLTGESEYQKALKGITDKLTVLSSEMKAVSSSFNKGEESITSLSQKNNILNKQLVEQNKVLQEAKKMLEQAKNSTESNEATVLKWQNAVNKAQAEVNKTTKELRNNEATMKDLKKANLEATTGITKLDKSIENVEKSSKKADSGFTVLKGTISSLLSEAISKTVDGVKNLASSMLELAEATKEYRSMMAKLEGSTLNFGYELEYTQGKFKEFYKYLGDNQAATNAITNLMGLKLETEKLDELVNGAIATWASYGDSIPIESLTESINETIQVGKVTGVMADAINWAGKTNKELSEILGRGTKAQSAFNASLREGEAQEDAFSAALEATTSKQERANIVAKFLNDTYSTSKVKYDELNQAMLEANETQIELSNTESKLGEIVEPLNTELTKLKNKLLQPLIPIIQKVTEKTKNWVKSANWDSIGKKVDSTMHAVKNGFEWIKKNGSAIVKVLGNIAAGFATIKASMMLQSAVKVIQNATLKINLLKLSTDGAITSQVLLNSGLTATEVLVGVLTGKISLLTVAQSLLTKAWSAFTAVISANPIVAVTTALVALVAGINAFAKASEKEYTDAIENIISGMDDFNESVKSGENYLSKFEDVFAQFNEKSMEIDDGIKEVQDGITQITELASKERRDLTDSEIKKIEEYLEKLRNLQTEELELEMAKSKAIQDQAMINAQNREMSLAEYQADAQKWLATAQSQADSQIDIIEQQAINEIALLNQKYGDKANLQNEAYAKELETINTHKNEQIIQAHESLALLYSEYSKGFTDRLDLQEKMLDAEASKWVTFDNTVEKETERHENAKKELSETYANDKEALDRLLEQEEAAHKKQLAKIYAAGIKDMDEQELEQVGVWLAMVANTELYGGELDEKTQETFDNLILAFDKLPDETKDTMKNALSPMLTEMEKTSPSLFAKATNIAQGILNRLRTAFDIHSPSKKTKSIFKNVMAGMSKGIDEEEGSLLSQVSALASNVVSKLNNSFNANGLTKGISGNLGLEMQKVQNQINSAIPSTINTTVNAKVRSDINNDKYVNAFRDALKGVKIVMDDEKFGDFVVDKVEGAVYG